MGKLHTLEKKIVIVCNQHKSKVLDIFSDFISNVSFLVITWILIAGVVIFRDFLTGIVLVVGLATVFLLHFLISEGVFKLGAKYFSWERKRPYLEYPKQIKGIGHKFADSSFPSSHVAAMTGGIFVLTYFYPFFLFWGFLIVLIMGWSRLRNGMHYPSDILGGIILGIIYGWLAMEILNLIF